MLENGVGRNYSRDRRVKLSIWANRNGKIKVEISKNERRVKKNKVLKKRESSRAEFSKELKRKKKSIVGIKKLNTKQFADII